MFVLALFVAHWFNAAMCWSAKVKASLPLAVCLTKPEKNFTKCNDNLHTTCIDWKRSYTQSAALRAVCIYVFVSVHRTASHAKLQFSSVLLYMGCRRPPRYDLSRCCCPISAGKIVGCHCVWTSLLPKLHGLERWDLVRHSQHDHRRKQARRSSNVSAWTLTSPLSPGYFPWRGTIFSQKFFFAILHKSLKNDNFGVLRRY